MTRFATADRLAWAGLAPGDNESAGKRKKAAARKGNQHLRTAMTESAWTVSRTATRPGARFRRLARRFGRSNEGTETWPAAGRVTRPAEGAAWRAGLKSITIYCYGARPDQVLTLAGPHATSTAESAWSAFQTAARAGPGRCRPEPTDEGRDGKSGSALLVNPLRMRPLGGGES